MSMRVRVRMFGAVAALLPALTLVARAQTSPQAPDASAVFRGGVELVQMSATVFDRDGRLIGDLAAADFEIFEDGEPQDLAHFTRERVPLSLGVVLDVSPVSYTHLTLATKA